MRPTGDDEGTTASAADRRRAARLLDLGIALSAAATVALAVAAVRPPCRVAAIPATAMTPEGGRAFTFSTGFAARWPFVLPSHPALPLQAGDVVVTEDGRSIGALTPSHEEIRGAGGGRYDVWNDALWFSSGDGADPRGDGRRYGVLIKARLAGSAVATLAACFALLAALVSHRAGTGLDARRLRSGGDAPSRWSAVGLRRAGRLPPVFRRTFVLFCVAMLGAFGWNSAARPMPLLFGDDSFTFVFPGVLWNAGESVAGQSTRDVGYAALTALALRFGSLRAIPPLQLVAVLVGIAALLRVLYLMLAPVASRLWRVPVGALTACSCLAAAAYGAMLAGDDGFVVDIYRALGEAPHLLPTALSLLFFVLGWIARAPARRVASMILATVCADLSVAVKPHSSLVLVLCGLGLLVTAVRARGAFRSPAVLALCALSAASIVSVHRFDRWVTPAGFDFGPKLLFCNHLDVAEPVFDASTPERARVKEQIESTLRHPHPDWPLLGYHGDTCTFGDAFNRAIVAAARAEGDQPAAWMMREFVEAVLHNPGGYVRAVWKQVAFVLADPIADMDGGGRGVITEREWRSFEPYAASIGMPRDAFDVAVSNWVPVAFPQIAAVGKALLGDVAASFWPLTVFATCAAAAVLVRSGRKGDVQAEMVLLSIAAFWTALILTPALAHTFDVRRYLTDVLPFSLLWWIASAIYLAQGAVSVCTLLVGEGRVPFSITAEPTTGAQPLGDQSSIS